MSRRATSSYGNTEQAIPTVVMVSDANTTQRGAESVEYQLVCHAGVYLIFQRFNQYQSGEKRCWH